MYHAKLLCSIALNMMAATFLFSATTACAADAKIESSAGPKKLNVAVLNLKAGSGINPGESELISDRLRGELFNTGMANVMEREQMQEVLKEQGFQQSGACSDEACLVEMGQMLGVQQLITGSIGKLGSIFMVNIRAIDVRTAKITKVVSRDIKGGIEDVASELPGVATELVSSAIPAQAAQPQQPAVQQAKETPAASETPRPEPQKTAALSSPDQLKKDRNKNRSGVRFEVSVQGNKIGETETETVNSTAGVSTAKIQIDDNDTSILSIQRSPMLGLDVKFAIAAGPWSTIDVGFGYAHQNTIYTFRDSLFDSSSYMWVHPKTTQDFYVAGLRTGINFVKRWYPFKLNVGLIIDYDYLAYLQNMTAGGYDSTAVDAAFNVAFGGRVGAEYLITPHMGVNAEVQYIYEAFTTFGQSSSDYYGDTYKIVWDFLMPSVAFTVGFNIYF